MSNNPRSGDRSGEHEFKIRRRRKTKRAPPCPGCGSVTQLHPDSCNAHVTTGCMCATCLLERYVQWMRATGRAAAQEGTP
jgi:hypothetical protein